MEGIKILIMIAILSPCSTTALKRTVIATSISSSFVRGLTKKSSSFVVVSEGQYDHAHHTHHSHDEHQVLDPHFTSKNATVDVYVGATATLDCTIHDITNESVSWLRVMDDKLELLTWETQTYSQDSRYSLVQDSGDKWQKWELVIRDAQVKDQGQYRCQVATQPAMLLVATINITEPKVRVVDERGTKVLEKHYNSGSMIELKCVIECVPFPHGPVTWKRGQETLSFNTSIGGISVKGNAETGFIRSRLYVANASPTHSGVYSCWYNNYSSDSVTVHVIAGENSAAMQDDKVPGGQTTSGSSSLTSHLSFARLPYRYSICLLLFFAYIAFYIPSHIEEIGWIFIHICIYIFICLYNTKTFVLGELLCSGLKISPVCLSR